MRAFFTPVVYADVCLLLSSRMFYHFKFNRIQVQLSPPAWFFRPLAFAVLIAPLCAAAQTGPQLDLQRTKLSAGMHLVDVQIAPNARAATDRPDDAHGNATTGGHEFRF